MKRISKVILTFLVIFTLTGCVRVETIISVNKDGSGTITEKVMFSKAFADMMRSFGESFSSDQETSKGFFIFDEEKLIKQAADYGADVTYQSGKEISEKDWEGYSATYAFADISKIRLNTDQNDKVDTGMDGPGIEEESTENQDEFYYFEFEKGKNPRLTIKRTELAKVEKEVSDEDDSNTSNGMDEMGKEMMKMFEGMRFNTSVVVNGKISQTNATYTEGSKITLLDLDFGELLKNKDAFGELAKNKPTNTADMKVLMEKFDGLKVELEQPVVVNFK